MEGPIEFQRPLHVRVGGNSGVKKMDDSSNYDSIAQSLEIRLHIRVPNSG